MAKLGFRKLEDMVGRNGQGDSVKAIEHWKASGIDLTPFCISPKSERKWLLSAD